MAKSKRKNTIEQESEILKDILESTTIKDKVLEKVKVNIKCKSENQKKLVKSIQEKDITICSGPAGTGKTIISCAEALSILKRDPKIKKIVLVKSITTLKEEEMGFLKGPQPYYEKVLTPNGWKTMEEIKIGDLVIGQNGKPTKVINVYEKGEKEVYRLTMDDNRYTDCCLDHIWRIKTSKLDFFDVTTDFIIKNIKNENFFLPSINPVEYNSEKLPIHPYLLGVLIGDGCLTASHVRFCGIDNEIVEKIRNIAKEYDLEVNSNNITHTLTTKRIGTQKGSKEIKVTNLKTGEEFIGFLKDVKDKFKMKDSTIHGRCNKGIILNDLKFEFTGKISKSNNKLKEILIDIGIMGLRSYEKYIPKIFKTSSIEERIELLRGLLDTDGSIKKNGEICYTTSSEVLAEDIKEIVLSLGGSARIYNHPPQKKEQKTKNGVIIQRKLIKTVYIKFLNDEFNPFFLKRKSERFKPLKPTFLKIKSVEKLNFMEKMKCISVDNENSLYITKDFIVTHNTISDKLEPVMYSFSGNFEKILGDELFNIMKSEGFIEERPIAYVRGVTIDSSIVIIDECQNISIENLRTLLTRIGENSKYVLLGDEKQIDLKDKNKSSLKIAMEKFEDKEGFGVVKLGSEDVVRHRLINTIEQVFDEIVEEIANSSNANNKKKKEVVNQISSPTLLLEDKKDSTQ